MTEPLRPENPFEADPFLAPYLKNLLPENIQNEIFDELKNFGQRVSDEIEILGLQAEANQPQLNTKKNWVETDEAWRKLDHISAEEKLIALGYEREYGKYSRVIQFAKIYLFHPSSAYYSCPLAMADGAAKLIETYGNENLKNTAFKHLTATDPESFWTSGQWMTERSGGSDLSGTECFAS